MTPVPPREGDPARALDQPVRRRIYRHLLVLPGDHLRSVARRLRLDLGSVRYHLGVLVRRGLVLRETVEGLSRFYPVGEGSEYERNRLYTRHWQYSHLRFRVLLALTRMGAATPAAVARALGISRQLAAYHLSRLEELGHVRRHDGRYVPRR